MSKVLVLDPEQRAALATVRSLGKRGITVITAGHTSSPIAAASRHASAHFALPDPAERPTEFVHALGDLLTREIIDVLMPVTDLTTSLVLDNPALLALASTALPTPAAYHRLSDKYGLFETAQTQGLPMPRTVFLDDAAQLDGLELPFPYPVVVKPARSRIFFGGRWISTSVAYAKNAEELRTRIAARPWFPHVPILLQEYVTGEGQGVFCLFDRGEAVAFFAHRRLREKPPSGGVSVLCESSAVPSRLRETAVSLLTQQAWHGLAMVEFKVGPDGTPYLMEVNARPWGSMQLAIDAGVDFPYYQYCIACGIDVPREPRYRQGVRSRWLLGDLDRLYLVLKDRSGRYSAGQKLRQALEFLNPFSASGYDTLQLRDLGPFRAELSTYLRQLRH